MQFYLWNVNSRPEKLKVLPHLFRLVLWVEDCQLSKHAHVCSLQAQSCFQQVDQLIKVSTVLCHTIESVFFVSYWGGEGERHTKGYKEHASPIQTMRAVPNQSQIWICGYVDSDLFSVLLLIISSYLEIILKKRSLLKCQSGFSVCKLCSWSAKIHGTNSFKNYLIVVYKILQLISMNNYVKTTVLGKAKLFIVHTCKTNFLPRSCTVKGTLLCYTRRLHTNNILHGYKQESEWKLVWHIGETKNSNSSALLALHLYFIDMIRLLIWWNQMSILKKKARIETKNNKHWWETELNELHH